MLNLLRSAFLFFASFSAAFAMAADIHRELEDIAQRLATKIEDTGRSKVAVADFTDLHSVVHELGRFISEEVSTNLVLSSRGFSVIDRNHLRTILREQKLSMSGLMDPENQKKLGKILGVDALVLGSITPFGESYRITFKVVATDTAQVITADRGMVPKTPATDELWETIIEYDFVDQSSSAPSKSPGTARLPAIISQPSKGKYGSQFLTFSIESLGVSKDNNTATLVGRLTNVSKHDIYVAVASPTKQTPGVSVVDDAGTLWVRASGVVGLPTYPYDSGKMMKYRTNSSTYIHYNINTHYALMTPGQSQPVNIAFNPVGNAGDPKIFSFSANLFLKVPVDGRSEKSSQSDESEDEWRYTQTAIGISGIKLD